MRASVVGGGLAGLAAALELLDAGAQVTLYEARSRLGGATFSFERNGLWLDKIRASARQRMLTSPLGNTPLYVAAVERAYEEMWRLRA